MIRAETVNNKMRICLLEEAMMQTTKGDEKKEGEAWRNL